MSVDKSPSALQFPCDFTLKIMGKNTSEFEPHINVIVAQHFATHKTARKLSKNGQYLALSVTVHAESQSQLDALYRALSSDPAVSMAL